MESETTGLSSDIETYFRTYFHHLGTFAWDKAKEFSEKEKQDFLPNPFQIALTSLAHQEKLYYSLAFLEQKSWFGRRDSHRIAYLGLEASLRNIQQKENRDSDQQHQQDSASTTMSAICVQLADFCSIRLSCIALYGQILKTLPSGSLDEICSEINKIIEVSMKLSSELINPLQESLHDELNAVLSLLQSSQAISSWEYVNAVHNIQDVASTIAKWKPILAKNQGSSLTFRSGFFGFGEKSSSNPTSALCNWMEKFFNFLISKFTFYFYENLSNTTSSEEMKSALSKLSFDFVSKSLNLVKKYDAKNISLVMDTRDLFIGPTHGFTFTDPTDNPSLINPVQDFTALLSLPQSSSGDTFLFKSVLWTRMDELQPDKLLCNLSEDKKSTFFLTQIENKIYLVVTFNGQRSEKDAHLLSYFNEALQNLKLKRIASLLKPGSK
ncbi:KICSTOR subunit 2-like isoform X1 [Clavelina lepadiformis]|uniref:KICSTOR subunit 2-like isoform X1 n=1 Tax=Clavelina lepadiformis TaxID=159417 RepID=UPI0040435F7F